MATPIPENHATFTLAELTQLFGEPFGTLPDDGATVTSVTTDSRAVKKGSLFVALVGERMNGHAYAATAASCGAAAAILSTDVPELRESSVVRFIVPDTLVAWAKLAEYALARFRAEDEHRRVFLVTGSSGKTTTKEMLASLLTLRGKTSKTAGNLNNLIGLPATVLALPRDARYCVLEAGMSVPGEMERLASLAKPDVATIVNIGIAHAEGVGGPDGVLREKSAVYKYLSPDGFAIINRDDTMVVRGAGQAPFSARKVAYGTPAQLPHGEGYRLLDRRVVEDGAVLTIERETGPSIEIQSPFAGEAQALDFLCALACAEAVESPFTTAEMNAALCNVHLEGRATVHTLADGTTVIDDSYNANPASMASSLRTAGELARHKGARLVAVLGEMKELGAYAEKAHRELGVEVAAAGVALFIGCGGQMNEALTAAADRGTRTLAAMDASEAAILALREVYAKDVVLVKASRSVRAEQVVAALLSASPRARSEHAS